MVGHRSLTLKSFSLLPPMQWKTQFLQGDWSLRREIILFRKTFKDWWVIWIPPLRAFAFAESDIPSKTSGGGDINTESIYGATSTTRCTPSQITGSGVGTHPMINGKHLGILFRSLLYSAYFFRYLLEVQRCSFAQHWYLRTLAWKLLVWWWLYLEF